MRTENGLTTLRRLNEASTADACTSRGNGSTGGHLMGYDDPSLKPAQSGHRSFVMALMVLLAAVGITLAPRTLLAQNDQCLTDTIRLNTAWNHATNSLNAIGTFTPYWRVVADPSPNTTEPRPAAVILKHPAWANPFANSQWISAYPSSANDTNGTYTFEFCFCIGPNAKRPRLDFQLLADDSASVYLNGNFIGATTGGYTIPSHITNANPQFFVPGKNCLRVAVHNLGNVAMGFDIAGTVAADGVGLIKPQCCDSTGSIIGMKYWDKNCNGKRDQGEPGLPNWTIQLSNGQWTTTDALGNYYFMNLNPGNYIVSEVNQAGWTQTAPASSVYNVTLSSGQVIANLEFGNCKKAEDSCLQMGDFTIRCITVAGTNQPGYGFTAYLKSYLPCQQQSATVVGVNPAGVNVTPGSFSLTNSYTPVNFVISGPGATAGTTVSIIIRVCCPDAAGQLQCCTDTISVKLPECPPENDCFRLVEQTIECKPGPNGNTFEWCFNVYNQSGFTAFYFQLVPPAGVGVSPSTILFPSGVPNNTLSPRHCVTIGGPNATPGATLTFIVRMCDRQKQHCCTDTVRITLPDCPKPKLCCDDFLKRFAKLTNSASSNGNASVSGLVWAAGTGGAPIISASATLVSATVNGAPAFGYFTGGTLGGFGAGSVPPPPVAYPFSHDIGWGPSAPVNLIGAPFNLNIKFPPMAPKTWHDVVRYCIRFRFTDKNCVTCDTVICFTRHRFKIIIWNPIDWRKEMKEKGDERGIQSLGGQTIGGALTGTDSSTIQVDFPVPPQELGQVKYIGMTITPEDSSVSIENGTATGSGYELFFLERGMLASFQANPGESVTLNLQYSGLGEKRSMAHTMTLTYAVTDPATGTIDTLSEDLRLVLRRAGATGGDQLGTANTDLRDVRTFAIHLRNSNGGEETIDRMLINTDGNAKLVAVGPTSSQTQALLQFGSDGARSYVGEDMTSGAISVAPGAEHGPIYLTLAGVANNAATVHFVTLDANGQIISEGDLALTTPLSSVEENDNESSSSAMLRQSYPNPAAHSATIGFTLPASETVTLVVTDASGREVSRLIDGEALSGGDHAVFFDTAKLPSGTYYYTLRVGATTETRSMQVIR